MKKSLLILASLIILFATRIQAQSPQGSDPVGTVQGKVIDQSSGQPIPYSSIAIYSQRDSSLVTGAISGDDGSFIIRKVSFGRFYAEIVFIGYERKRIPGILIRPESNSVNLGDIGILEASVNLQEVTVTTERSPVEFHLDKKVVQVGENLNAAGGSVAQALENVPSVTVDIDGNVSLRGSSNFTVLIDGKPSPLEGSDALRQIPASAVENIEIITNPSAKYDPDGLSGIINVITKKRALDGFSGIVDASVGTGDKYRGDFLINYKNDKFSSFVGADFTDQTRAGERKISQMTIVDDTSQYIDHFGNGPFAREGYTLKGGMGYTLNNWNSLSLEGSYGYSRFSRSSNEYFKEYTIPSSSESYYILNESDSRYEDFYNLTFSYEKLFKSKDHKLTSYLYYAREWGGSDETTDQLPTDDEWMGTGEDPYRIYIQEPSRESELRFQIDYVKPVGANGKFESGYQLRDDRERESYLFDEWDSKLNDWVDNPDFTNALNFRRDIQAIYGMYSGKLSALEYQVGIRGEYTYRTIRNSQAESPSVLDRFDYFPTVHLSLKVGEEDQAQINYSRRINRPRGYMLDPFVHYMNPNTIRIGNPDLLPEYVDSYELAYQKGLGKSFISLEGYYRLTHEAMTRISEVMDDGTRVLSTKNLNEEHAMGAELMTNFIVNKWFSFNLSGNIYRYKLIGTVSDSDVNTSSTNYDSRLNANFRITPTTKFQLQGFYQGPSVTAQGRRADFLRTSAALRQDLFKNKLTATLQLQDIFGTSTFNFTNEGANYYDSIHMKRESQVVMLTLSFRINNYKKQNGQHDMNNNNGEDQQMDY